MPDRALDLKMIVSGTQKRVLEANPFRVYALLVNDGATDVYLGLSSPAVQNRGIRLNKEGGSYEINLTNLYHGSIHAVSPGTVGLLIQEW